MLAKSVFALLAAGLAAAQVDTVDTNLNFTGSCYKNKPKVPATDKQWGLMVKYATYCAATYPILFGQACPSPPFGSTLVKFISENSTDTQVMIFRDDGAEEIIVAYPGTTSAADYATDFNFAFTPYVSPGVVCEGCQTSAGFLGAYNSVADELIATVAAEIEKKPCLRVSITGHSLGGALAALTFPSFKGVGLPVHRVYTFGQPRVGNPLFANYVNRLSLASDSFPGFYFRVTHADDGVPNLPPIGAGFRHEATEFFQANGTNGRTSKELTSRCFGQDAPDCNLAISQGFINPSHLTYSDINLIGGLPGCGMPANATARGAATEAETAAFMSVVARKLL